MATKSKFFRVAVEGETATDGRKIEKSWLTDIAETYAPATYAARVNMEHIRGFSPDSPFKAYGDVLAVKTEEVTLKIGGKDERRLALYAQIDPTAELIAFTKARQKIFTSIEVAPNFGGKGKAGLVGLAVTDSPASLGTERLEFSVKPDNAEAAAVRAGFDQRKTDQANHFTAALQANIEFEEVQAPAGAGLKDQLTSFFSEILGTPKKEEPKEEPKPADAGDMAAFATLLQASLTKSAELFTAELGKVSLAITALRTDHDTLKADLDKTEKKSVPRSHATGGGDIELTDC